MTVVAGQDRPAARAGLGHRRREGLLAVDRDVLAERGGGRVIPTQHVVQGAERGEGGRVQPRAQRRQHGPVQPRRHGGEQQDGTTQPEQHPAAEKQGDHACRERRQRQQISPPRESFGAEDARRLEGCQPRPDNEEAADDDVGAALWQRGRLLEGPPPARGGDRQRCQRNEGYEHERAVRIERQQTVVGVVERGPIHHGQ